MHDTTASAPDGASENKRKPVFLHDLLGMEILSSEPGTIRARLRVEEKVCQIFGFLSGGASLALAETLAASARLRFAATMKHRSAFR